MNSLVVDTNVLVYIYAGVPEVGRKYADLLGVLSKKRTLVIPKLVYAELSLIFRDKSGLTDFLHDTGIVVGELGLEVYETAAERWGIYNKRRLLMCPSCGKKIKPPEYQ
jgi:predicted nucleic acid-binding protein